MTLSKQQTLPFLRSFTCVLCATVLAWGGLVSSVNADSISINFGADRGAPTGGDLGVVPVSGTNWNNASGATGTIDLNNNTGVTTGVSGTWSSANTWNFNESKPSTNNNGILYYGYLDDGGNHASFSMTSPYFSYDIYYYPATDSNGFRYVEINTLNYYGNNTGTVYGRDNWGTPVKSNIDAANLKEGVNYLKVSSSDLAISVKGVDNDGKKNRGSFGALQIVNTADSQSTIVTGGTLTWTGDIWTNDLTGETGQAYNSSAVGHRLINNGQTVTVDLGNTSINMTDVKILGTGSVTLTNGTTVIGQTYTATDLSKFGGTLELPCSWQLSPQSSVKVNSGVGFTEGPADSEFITGAYFVNDSGATYFAKVQNGVFQAVSTTTTVGDNVDLLVTASKTDNVVRTLNSLTTQADYKSDQLLTITSGMITLQNANHWIQGNGNTTGGTITSAYQNANGEYDLYICSLNGGEDMRIDRTTIVDPDNEHALNIIKTGSGAVSLSNATRTETYSGKTIVLEGHLQIGEYVRSTDFYVARGAQLDFSSRNYRNNTDFPDFDVTATSLSGNGTVEIGNANGKIAMTMNNVANDGSKFARVNAYGKSLTMNNSALHTAVLDSKTPITLTNSSIVADTFISSADSSVVFDATSTLDAAAIVTSAGALTLNIPADRNLSYAPTGAGGITKAGAGTLTLTEEPGYTGNTTINAGKLVTTAGGTLYNLSGASAGTLDNNGQAITLNNSSNTAFAGVITGAGSLTKTGSGKLEISNAINYTGDTTVSEGTLQINGASDGGKRFRGTITIANGAKLICNAHDSLGYSNDYTNVFDIYGTMDNASGNESFSNTTFNLYGGTISSTGGGSLDILAANDKIFTFALDGASATAPTVSTISSNIRLRADNQTLEIDTAANTQLKISGVISASSATQSITKLGAGTLTLSGKNTFSGDTFVNAGTLELTATGSTATLPKGRAVTVDGATSVLAGHGDILGYTSGAIGSLTLQNGGTLKNDQAGTHITVNNVIYMNNGVISAVGIGSNPGSGAGNYNYLLDNAIHVTGGTNNQITADGIWIRALSNTNFVSGDFAGKIDVAQGAKLTISSVIGYCNTENSGTTANITKTGAGELVLTAANVYNTETAISQGVLTLEESGTLGTGAVAIAENAVLNLNHDGDARFDNSVSGSGTINKNGNGVLKIYNPTPNNFVTDSFVVNAGELDFKGYLKGSLEIGEGSVFSPGNSVGDLIQDGTFTLDSGALLLIEQDATGIDTITATSFVLPEDSISLSITSIIPGATYDIIMDSNGFEADQLEESYWLDRLFDLPYYMNLSVVNGDTVRLHIDANAVPEPSTWALLVLGVAGLMYLRRRK